MIEGSVAAWRAALTPIGASGETDCALPEKIAGVQLNAWRCSPNDDLPNINPERRTECELLIKVLDLANDFVHEVRRRDMRDMVVGREKEYIFRATRWGLSTVRLVRALHIWKSIFFQSLRWPSHVLLFSLFLVDIDHCLYKRISFFFKAEKGEFILQVHLPTRT